MSSPRFNFWSSVGKKLLTGVTGVALIGFIIGHLAGNLTLIAGGGAFNAYAEGLHRLGLLLYVVEVGLVGLFLLHIVPALTVHRDKRRARSVHNTMVQTKGAQSKNTIFSRSMAVTGLVLLAFLVIHIIQFRFGPSIAEGYVTLVDGEPARDLYRLVVEVFKNPLWVLFYVGCMVLLGSHLRHGFWSAFQSLGLLDVRLRPLAYSAAGIFAVAVAAGFILLPLWLWLVAPLPLPDPALQALVTK
jgi:succinate dehydrogenase / fumarate reductase cytochrome b subunit